ncbi:MAG: hypothetical protein LR011_04205 [Verrucomicrobia bacterium]|nr:hypothetical protein [Verrucomicrobiota bacterium]
MKIKQREALLKMVAIATVVLLVGDSFVLQPLTAKWKETGQEIRDLRGKIQRGENILNRERTIQRAWRIYQRDDLDQVNPEAENQVLKSLENWMDQSRIKLTAVKPQWQNFDDRYNTFSLRLAAEGSLDQCVDFVHKIENDPLPVRIEEIEFSARDKDGETISLSLNISGLQLGKKL